MAPSRAVVVAILAAPFSTQLVACAGQGEGERCERKNGNDDCQEGLVCKSSKDLGGNADTTACGKAVADMVD